MLLARWTGPFTMSMVPSFGFISTRQVLPKELRLKPWVEAKAGSAPKFICERLVRNR
jgi:hypothetical protein